MATPRYLNSRAWTIFGGTDEVQKNIIAKTVLGLVSRVHAVGRGAFACHARPAILRSGRRPWRHAGQLNEDGASQGGTADLSARVTIRTVDQISTTPRSALFEIATDRGLRIAACSDIASKDQMIDADGGIINGEIFGWMGEGERWWEDTRLALSSPLPRACRYESEPMWVNAGRFPHPLRRTATSTR